MFLGFKTYISKYKVGDWPNLEYWHPNKKRYGNDRKKQVKKAKTNKQWIAQKSDCCGHHPEIHDELCGCMVSGCFCLIGVDVDAEPKEMPIQEALSLLHLTMPRCKDVLLGLGVSPASRVMTTTQFYRLKEYYGG